MHRPEPGIPDLRGPRKSSQIQIYFITRHANSLLQLTARRLQTTGDAVLYPDNTKPKQHLDAGDVLGREK